MHKVFPRTIYNLFCIYIVLVAGDVPRVDGQLAVSRAFGDKSLKEHLSSEPDVTVENIDDDTEFIILASDGIWKVGSLYIMWHDLLYLSNCYSRDFYLDRSWKL